MLDSVSTGGRTIAWDSGARDEHILAQVMAVCEKMGELVLGIRKLPWENVKRKLFDDGRSGRLSTPSLRNLAGSSTALRMGTQSMLMRNIEGLKASTGNVRDYGGVIVCNRSDIRHGEARELQVSSRTRHSKVSGKSGSIFA